MADQLIVAGQVDEGGRKILGGDFYVSKGKEDGHFSIQLGKTNIQIVGFTATQIYLKDGDTRDNVVILDIGPNNVDIKTGNGDGKGEYRSFSFVAVAIPKLEVAPK